MMHRLKAHRLQLLPITEEFRGEAYGMAKGSGLSCHGDEKMYGAGKFNPSDALWQAPGKGLALVAENVPFGSNEEGRGQQLEQGVGSKARADAVVAGIGTAYKVRGVESLHDFSVQSEAFTILFP